MGYFKEVLKPFLEWITNNFIQIIIGYVISLFSYFFEIKWAINILLFLIFCDLLFGILSSIIRRKEKFSMEKLTIAVVRALIFTSFVALLFAIDKETHQVMVSSWAIACWIFSMFFLWSASCNIDDLFNNKIFGTLRKVISVNFEKKTGFNLEENSNHGKF